VPDDLALRNPIVVVRLVLLPEESRSVDQSVSETDDLMADGRWEMAKREAAGDVSSC
jgi:hypothetical protein